MDSKGPFFFQMAQVSVTLPETNYKSTCQVAPGPKRKGSSSKHPFGCFENSGTPKSSILIGFSIINHPF